MNTSFLASHQLTLKDSGTEDEHCHNWVVQIAVCAEKLNEDGFVMDFCDLKEKIQAVVAKFEGKKLEDMDCFSGVNVSAEIVARYIFDRIEPQLDTGLQLGYVEVVEAAGCRAKYSN